MNWRRGGLAVLAALALAGPAGAQLAGQAVQGFRLPEYDEEGQLTGLKIEVFRRGEVTARIVSPDCAYDPERKRAASKAHIRIVTDKAVLTGEGFAWNGENQQFQIFKNARVVLDGRMDTDVLAPKPAAAPAPAAPEE